MKIKQKNKLDMYLAVLAVLVKFQIVWKNLPAFARGVKALDDAIREIQRLAKVQVDAPSGGAEKARALDELVDIAFEIAAAVRAWAMVAGDETLADRMHVTRTSLSRGHKAAVPGRCKDIHKAAVAAAPALSEYGVTEEKIGRLKDAIAKFEAQLPHPRENRVAGVAASKQLRDVIRNTDRIVAVQLVGLCVQFEAENGRFCDEFAAARSVVARRATHSVSSGGDPTPNPTPVPGPQGPMIEPGKAA